MLCVSGSVSQSANGHALGAIRYCPFLLPSVQVNRELYFLSPSLSLPPVNRLGERVDKAPFLCQPYVTQDSRDRIFFVSPLPNPTVSISLEIPHAKGGEEQVAQKRAEYHSNLSRPQWAQKEFLVPYQVSCGHKNFFF